MTFLYRIPSAREEAKNGGLIRKSAQPFFLIAENFEKKVLYDTNEKKEKKKKNRNKKMPRRVCLNVSTLRLTTNARLAEVYVKRLLAR